MYLGRRCLLKGEQWGISIYKDKMVSRPWYHNGNPHSRKDGLHWNGEQMSVSHPLQDCGHQDLRHGCQHTGTRTLGHRLLIHTSLVGFSLDLADGTQKPSLTLATTGLVFTHTNRYVVVFLVFMELVTNVLLHLLQEGMRPRRADVMDTVGRPEAVLHLPLCGLVRVLVGLREVQVILDYIL